MVATSELFKKHFGNTGAIGIFHPNIESFFSELNEMCLEDDRQKLEQIIYHSYLGICWETGEFTGIPGINVKCVKIDGTFYLYKSN